jgi:hypothetical protein
MVLLPIIKRKFLILIQINPLRKPNKKMTKTKKSKIKMKTERTIMMKIILKKRKIVKANKLEVL